MRTQSAVSPGTYRAEALVQRLGNRDVEAFAMLYEAHVRMVFGIGLRLLRDAPSAEDLTQTVFLKVWANPSSFKGGSLTAWIARVARNAGLDVLRRRSVQRQTEIPADVPVDGMFEETVFAHLDAQRVRSALVLLPAAERTAIEMGFFGGMTYRTVATEIGVPLGTVKTRIRTGLHRLRDVLQSQSNGIA